MTLRLAALLVCLAGLARAEPALPPLVEPAWLAAHLDQPVLLIVDLRNPVSTATDYAQGHIPGAVPAPFASFGWATPAEGLPPADLLAPRLGALGIGPDTQVVLVADGINAFEIGKATRAFWLLKALGHDPVAVLDGGEIAWEAAGLPLIATPATAPPQTFRPAPRRELALTTDQVIAGLGRLTPVDARTPEEFSGQRKEGPVARAGTLPGARNLPHDALYGFAFVTPDAARALAQAAGIPVEGPVFTFCSTGHWATLDWFVLTQIAGRADGAVYPGSMSAWTEDPRRPLNAPALPAQP